MTRVAPLLAPLLLAGAVAACAPEQAAGTASVPPYAVGLVAPVTYGTIIGARPVTVRGRTGLGGAAGAVAGGIAGSFIGGDWRASLLAGLGGALLGGLAGSAIEGAATTTRAVEFTVREDGGDDIATVQPDEDGLRVGERVAIIRGERTRLARAGAASPRSSAATVRAATVAATPVAVPRTTPLAGHGAAYGAAGRGEGGGL